MCHKFRVLVILFLAVLLASCSHNGRKDGPPNYNIDVSRIPNATPRSEPLARYGNYPSYVVFGKRYYTMKNSHRYDQVGTASWYGTKFHEHKTSSGERYDMLGMTAAHKTLPLPTYVEVTNLANDKKVIVKVNDRGPFESNRIIDLSYVAAKKLGMLGHGTARVRVKAINTDSYAENTISRHEKTYPRFRPVHQAAHQTKKPVYLQVGAFRDKERAVKLQRRLNSSISSNAPVKISKDKLYKVKIGPIRDTVALEKITNQLKGMGIRT